MAKDNKRYLAKLSTNQVKEIINLLKDERGIKQQWIADRFGVSQSTIAFYNRRLKKELESYEFQH